MEVVLGALPSLIPKLGELLADEYKLHKGVKEGIMFLQEELVSMKGALEHISEVPPDQLPPGDKIWARNVRELSYDIEDKIDIFMVQVKGHQSDKEHGFKKKITEMILGFPSRYKIRRKIGIDIRGIKSSLTEVHDRRRRNKVNHTVVKPVRVDHRALVQFEKVTDLVGIEESRDEVIKILMEANEVSKQQERIVSLVGFGGLGKTTLVSVVYEKLRQQFDCSTFVSVSQTPDMVKLFKDIFYKLDEKLFNELAIYTIASLDVIINELRKFLRDKRYFVVVDDIWEIKDWNEIRCALIPDDSAEFRIITTTRSITIAEQIGTAYKMKPLSPDNSRVLLNGRIFGNGDKEKCPNEHLEEVSNRIIKKCGGVPLAIITIASLLVTRRSKLEWYDVCNSIGAGLEENDIIENMRRVLSLSYFDMPSHLKTCLLYLSMFPEDCDIRKDRLIWLWIAEGFIQSQNQDKRLFEIGESYLNDLINRSMVQPRHDTHTGMMNSCRVHDMVLDLIRSLSSEENFVTIQNNTGHSSASKKVRRISFQNAKASHDKPEAILNEEHHVRSVIDFRPRIDYIPVVLENLSILRVLDLEYCDFPQSNSLKHLGNLLHLRYLSLRNTNIAELPEEIGKLQLLQMLDAKSSRAIPSLPSSIVRLTQLMCLRINRGTRVPEGIGSLIALEELSCIEYEEKMLEQLADLTKLKVLDLEIKIGKFYQDVDKSVVEILNKLQKIQSLDISISSVEKEVISILDGRVVTAPENLRRFFVRKPCLFATLPAWLKVNPSLLSNLCSICITVKWLPKKDLEILGRLPALHYLMLDVYHGHQGIHNRFDVGAFSFPCLIRCFLSGLGGPVVFEHGAMPRLNFIEFEFPVQQAKEINGSFDLGLGNLLSLQQVDVRFKSFGASEDEVEEAEAALRHAIEVHPNHPTIQCRGR